VAGIDGDAAVALVDIDRGWELGVHGDGGMPQHSTFKLWLAVAVAAAVERGEVAWTDRVRIEPAHLVFPYQPIAAEVPPEGRTFVVEDLVRRILLVSDNPSADALSRHLGGVDEVQAALERRHIEGVRITATEAQMHERVKRLKREARSLPDAEVPGFLRRSLREPPNPATTLGAARGLARLARGELLGEDATERIIGHMIATDTGPHRLRAGLSEGWTLAHKTGTGFAIRGVRLGVHDIGIMTSPAGRRFAVAVFIAGTTEPLSESERVIAEVARAIREHH
jgi:beta-lactamase class A